MFGDRLPLFPLMDAGTTFYLLIKRYGSIGFFQEFKNHIELLCNRKIQAFQFDNGGEFLVLKHFLSEYGIAHWRSCPHVHQQMGMVKRRHRHILDIGLSLLHHAKLPLTF